MNPPTHCSPCGRDRGCAPKRDHTTRWFARGLVLAAMMLGNLAASRAETSPQPALPTFQENAAFWEKVSARLRASGMAERFRLKARLVSAATPESAADEQRVLAEDAQDRLVLPGSDGVPIVVGSPPRWFENPTPTHDNEFVWTLNRMAHWCRLARAFALTGKEAYANQVLSEIDDWITRCPVPSTDVDVAQMHISFEAATPWRSLDAGIRMERSWADVVEALADSPLLTPERLERIVRSMEDHGRVLFLVCPKFWPNADHNHYLSENAGLLRLSLLFPELPESAQWIAHARHELERCAQAQLTADGGQIEGCPLYHNVCLRSLGEIVINAREHGLQFSPEFLQRLGRAMTYTLHTYRPSGTLVPFNDSDAVSVTPLVTACTCALALDRWDELTQLHAFAPAESFRQAVAETLWHAPEPRAWLDRAAKLGKPAALPRANWQRQLGQAMMRTDWTAEAASVAVNCHTPIQNGHAHIDPASFDFTAFGRPLAVDPARYTYAETQARRDFKSATWHNTITVNDREPFAYINTWKFGPQKPGTILSMFSQPGWQAAECVHQNFDPVLHRRLVVLLDDPAMLLVVDALDGLTPSDKVQLWFHLDSTKVKIGSTDTSAETSDADEANLRLVGPPGLQVSALPGRVSDVIDSAHGSTRLRFSDNGGETHRIYLTQLLPRSRTSREWPEVAAVVAQSANQVKMTIRKPQGTQVLVWQPGENQCTETQEGTR